jgi:hypothetical protein
LCFEDESFILLRAFKADEFGPLKAELPAVALDGKAVYIGRNGKFHSVAAFKFERGIIVVIGVMHRHVVLTGAACVHGMALGNQRRGSRDPRGRGVFSVLGYGFHNRIQNDAEYEQKDEGKQDGEYGESKLGHAKLLTFASNDLRILHIIHKNLSVCNRKQARFRFL